MFRVLPLTTSLYAGAARHHEPFTAGPQVPHRVDRTYYWNANASAAGLDRSQRRPCNHGRRASRRRSSPTQTGGAVLLAGDGGWVLSATATGGDPPSVRRRGLPPTRVVRTDGARTTFPTTPSRCVVEMRRCRTARSPINTRRRRQSPTPTTTSPGSLHPRGVVVTTVTGRLRPHWPANMARSCRLRRLADETQFTVLADPASLRAGAPPCL
jgi:hypothetical protein